MSFSNLFQSSSSSRPRSYEDRVQSARAVFKSIMDFAANGGGILIPSHESTGEEECCWCGKSSEEIGETCNPIPCEHCGSMYPIVYMEREPEAFCSACACVREPPTSIDWNRFNKDLGVPSHAGLRRLYLQNIKEAMAANQKNLEPAVQRVELGSEGWAFIDRLSRQLVSQETEEKRV